MITFLNPDACFTIVNSCLPSVTLVQKLKDLQKMYISIKTTKINATIKETKTNQTENKTKKKFKEGSTKLNPG